MTSSNIRVFTVLCTIIAFVLVNSSSGEPIRHYGRCNVGNESGYCQHRQQCWEQGANFSSSARSLCPIQLRRDLVCCRRAPLEIVSSALNQLLPQPGVCGFVDSIEHRVISGTISRIRDFPWMALLRKSSDGEQYTQLCGGSLIHERWVLTAAHCVPSRGDSQTLLQVRLGEWNTTGSPDCQRSREEEICAPPHIDMNVDRIIIHEEYVEEFAPNAKVINDIALLRLQQPVNFSEFVQPICLPASNANDEYTYADYGMDIAGWGNTEHIRFGGSAIKLRAVVNALSMANCRKIYPHVVSGQLCAGGETMAGTCRGDSGGPLMHQLAYDDKENRAYYIAGIVSLGTANCNNGGQPMIFTRVEHYVPWIIGTISANI